MSKLKKDKIIGLFLIAFGAFILYFSTGIKMINGASYGVGSAFFPRICGVFLILLGAALSVGDIVKNKKSIETGTAAPVEDCSKMCLASLIRMSVTIVTLVLFVALLRTVGFLICAIFMQFVLMVTLAPEQKRTRKNILGYLIISICTALIIDLLFVKVFDLILPAGILKGVF